MCALEVDPRVAQRYLLKRRLGKGAYGIVWKAVDRKTGEVVAIKKIFDAFRDKTDAQRTYREILLLQEFGDHPNIIRLLDVIWAENDRDIYLVFESMDTDLNAIICKGRLLKDVHKRYIFCQLLRATKFIHSGRVIHRDQKPSNVLLDTSCTVKLCDFGLARPLSSLTEGPEGQALTEYTPGVDMWSLGCILGEMLRGRPLFPGTSTLHQLELILATIPPPSQEDLLALGSNYSTSILHCLGSHRPRQTLDALLPPDTPPEALDLLGRLLVFAPDKRLSAAQALQHPYVQRFHCPALEWTLEVDVRLPVQEGAQLSAHEYRNHLYQMILECRGNSHVQREKALRDNSWPQVHLLKPRAGPLPPAGWPAQNLPRRPQRSLGQVSAHDAPCGAKTLPRQNSASLLRPPPPEGLGRGASPPAAMAQPACVPSWAKTGVMGTAPSLTSQAATRVAIQALIRGDQDAGRGVKAADERRVPHGLLPEARPERRPGRRMFSALVSQGTQGAVRAALGGYSQAYGSLSGSRQGSQPASVTSCNKVASICSLSDHLSFSVRDFLEVHHHPFPGALLLWKTPTPCLVQSPPEAMWAVLSLQVTKTAWGLPGGQLPLPQCPGASG
ncbi:mitogen-activated protein kinase 15 isoform X3 [Manis pentadactyla]|uniref:mitogen-activated protein kinase 15 isoform X3 n=1 Tax=Manis pentadactyla TaxID=143292 RepID=UPI00255C8B7D|nr:mitogen-activated protein kinase 15 isoform X3 [Manis pentadactyla]